MRSSWLTRLKVAALATVVLSGGSGLPMLDALLYHTGAGRGVSQTGTHWAMPRSPDHPAARCTLGRAAPVPDPSPPRAPNPDSSRSLLNPPHWRCRPRLVRPSLVLPFTPELLRHSWADRL